MPTSVPIVATMHAIQPTELRELVLPVLSCLPTAFFSPNPPPALLPLLSPILRQRVHLLANGGSSEPLSQGSWLKLLTWSSERAEKLTDIVSRLQLEPHPVSGELELFGDTTDPEAGKVWYRRLDEETVQARCDAKEYDLEFIFVWSSNDTGGVGFESSTNGTTQDAWKVAEVVPLDGDENLPVEGWQDDLAEAQRVGGRSSQGNANGESAAQANNNIPVSTSTDDADDDEDAYWAAYDRTPGKGTPAPTRSSNVFSNQGQSEQAYFERYGGVQPVMDAHDPDGDSHAAELGASGRQNTLSRVQSGQPHDRDAAAGDDVEVFRNLNNAIEQQAQNGEIAMPVGQRAPTTTQPRGAQDPPSPTVASLERSASEGSPAAETSIKHHISHEIKSLFRLAQGVGIDREEFNELVQRELDVLDRIEL